MPITYEVPKIGDLKPSSADYMSQLEAGLRRLDVITEISKHEIAEVIRSFPQRFVDILQQKGIEAKISPKWMVPDLGEQLLRGTVVSIEDGLVATVVYPTDGTYYRRLIQDSQTAYERSKTREQWKLDDKEKKLKRTRTDFENALHKFTTITRISDNPSYENSIYYLVGSDGKVFRVYIDIRSTSPTKKDAEVIEKPYDIKLIGSLYGSFFDKQAIASLRVEAERLKVRAYFVRNPSTYFDMKDLMEHCLHEIEWPNVKYSISRNLKSVLELVVSEIKLASVVVMDMKEVTTMDAAKTERTSRSRVKAYLKSLFP